ncbi:MAG: response regulator transcription factor [Planctomycetes bacterium]|nr:response regulator transcription factor [Planctomycetota bacterium]
MNQEESVPAPRAKAKVMVVDDHALVRRGLSALIGSEPDLEVCGEAADAVEALARIDAQQPDLVIVDLSLQNGHGLDLIRQLRARDAGHPRERVARVLVLSMHDEALFAERSLRAGAHGYINKQEATDKVVHAIRQVLAGKVYLSGAMTERMLQRATDGDTVEAQLPSERLSDRELTVFQMIGEGLGTREIAERLHLSIKTIETYREHIKAKLGLKNSAELGRHAAQWVLENT